MSIRDTITLQGWLKAGLSYDDVYRLESCGLVENQRFSESARRAFFLIWEWSAIHFESKAQDRVYNKCGLDFLNRRITRMYFRIERFKRS